jgi:quinoprotein glucose dehydrogenase
MRGQALISPNRPRSVGDWLVILFAILLLVIGVLLAGGGVWLIGLGGSWYYLLAGIGLLASGVLLLRGSAAGVWIYAITYVCTWIWALWEVGLDGWPLVPRVVAPTVLLIPALLCLLVVGRPRLAPVGGETAPRRVSRPGPAPVVVVLAALAVLGGLALRSGHGVAQGVPEDAATPAATPEAAPSAAPTTGEAAPAAQAGSPAAQPASPAAETAAAPANEVAAARPPAPPMDVGADWPAYGGSNAALRYSPLDQITPANVGELKPIWTYRTGDLPDQQAEGKYSPETTPIKIGDHMFLCSAKNILLSVNAATGKEEWRYDPKVSDDAIPYGATCRGVAYYASPTAAPDAACATRIIEGTLDARLIAVDARTGQPCADFGTAGAVDLTEGIGETVPGWYSLTAVPVVVRGIVVVGAQVQDGQAEDAPSGVIRGYDAVTGALAWAWDMGRPDATGAPPEGETYTRGTPNMWTTPAADEELGYVYVPLGNSSVDYYGGNRAPYENEYNSSLVALDVTTGRPVWHFQTVHYDLWDYDLGSQPTLADVPTDSGTVPAVILPSKQGEIYVLDRRTGAPLFPTEERDAPKGGVEPDRLSPTQPYSGFATVAQPPLEEKDMWGMSPLDQMWCRIQFRQAEYDGRYTPPTLDRHFIEYPSYNGGTDWGSVAVDPTRNILIVNYNNMVNYDQLITRDAADRLGLAPINVPHDGGPHTPDVEYAVQAGAPYAVAINPGWRQWTGLMCTQPPYGGIRAIDLATGKTLWDHPLGDARANGPFGIHSGLTFTIGTPNNGGPLITASGLVFIAATTDDQIRAFDIKTGEVKWQASLPAGGQSTPMAFEAGGREFIGFMAGGHHFMQTPVGDYVLAYGLPDQG